MRVFAPGFLLGVFIIFGLSALPKLYLLLFAFIITSMLHYYFRKQVSWFFLAVMSGALWAVIQGHGFMHMQLATRYENKPIIIKGWIVDLPEANKYSSRLLFKTPSLGKKAVYIRLTWYYPVMELKPGQYWQLRVKLQHARGLSSPGAIDFQALAVQQGISSVGYVLNDKQNKLLSDQPYTAIINHVRYNILQQQHKLLPNIIGAQFISALTIGDRAFIQPYDWQVLQATGTNHLVAIAGLHIGLVTALLFFLTKRIVIYLPRVVLWFPAQQIAACTALIGAMIYASLAGFALPTRRALIMLSLLFLTLLIKRKLPAWHSYCLALFLVVLLEPACVLAQSFWLSFTAVGVIIYVMTGHLMLSNKLKQTLSMQYAVSLGVLPCTLLFFQKASLISPLANALVVPVVGFVVIPLGLIGSFALFINHWCAIKLLWLAAYSMHLTWLLLVKLASIPHAVINTTFLTFSTLIYFSFGLLLLLAPRGFPTKYLGLFLLLPALFAKKEFIPLSSVKLAILDVGQGLAMVLQTTNHNLIFDTGPAVADGGFNAGISIVIPYLFQHGIHQVDLLMISHGDNDHAGGAAAIMQNISVAKISSSVPEKFPAAYHCYAGQTWEWDKVKFTVISPTKLTSLASKNNQSCVLRIEAGAHAILLTGDIEKASEDELLQNNVLLAADILQVPHHGSRTSSSVNFVNAVHPDYAVISLGYHNRFHFPATVVVQRYQAIRAKIYDTAKSGTLIFTIYPHQKIKPPVEYRETIVRWWRQFKI